MGKVNRIFLGFPWYAGPDKSTFSAYFTMMHYFGRLQERSLWLSKYGNVPEGLHDLDRMHTDGDKCEITADDGIFEFSASDESGLSLPGLARERLVESAKTWGADWLMMWDYDMLFSWSVLLRLWRHQKPVCAALAFTARDPIQPVIYKIREVIDPINGIEYHSQTVHDYPKDRLVSSADIGGSLGFGAAVVLINMNVFNQIPKPWFHSTGCGEDWFFCIRCHQNNVPCYVDTSVKTLHKKFDARWVGEQEYEQMMKDYPDTYKRLIENQA